MRKKWTSEEDQILRDNRGKLSAKDLGILLNRSTGSVSNRICVLRLPRFWNYKHYVNHDFFEHLTEESAYWLGFIFADGCVRPELNMLVVQIQLKDKPHLELLHSKIGGSIKVNPSSKNSATLSVSSKKIIKDLISYGCTKAKSLTLQFPDLPLNLIPSFIRGYLDGDGCIFNCHGALAFNILGTKSFLERLNEYLPFKSNVNLKHKSRIHVSTYYSNKAVENLNWLYQDSNLCLHRKWSKLTDLSLQN